MRGADVGATDDSGKTPLHRACVHGAHDCVRDLLEAGADPNAQDSNDRTPLMDGNSSVLLFYLTCFLAVLFFFLLLILYLFDRNEAFVRVCL